MKQLLMDKLIHWNADGSAKVWYVYYDPKTAIMTTRWGKDGAALQESAKMATVKNFNDTVNSKLKKGYVRDGKVIVGDDEVPDPSGGKAQNSSKQFGDAVLYWSIDKTAFAFRSSNDMQKLISFIGESYVVKQDATSVTLRAGKSEILISPEPASLHGMLMPDEWEASLLLLKLSAWLPIGFSNKEGSSVSKRHEFKAIFNDPQGYDELCVTLGLAPKMTTEHREAAMSFF